MLFHISWRSFCAILGLCVVTTVGVADDPKPRETLQSILDRVRVHTANEDWRSGRFEDKQIETWIDSLVADATRLAEKPALKVPIRFSGTQPIDPFYGVDFARIRFADEKLDLRAPISGLLICKNVRLSHARRSIVLSDGDIRATWFENSVVISRGSVRATVAKNSVIIAGTYVHILNSGERGSAENGNVIISRGWADISSAFGTTIAAQAGATVSEAEDSVLINIGQLSKVPEGVRTVLAPELTIGRLQLHPMGSNIEFVGVLHSRKRPNNLNPSAFPAGLVFRFDSRQYVANLDEPIVDEFGKPVVKLAGWKLKYISEEIAILRNGDAEAVVRIIPK